MARYRLVFKKSVARDFEGIPTDRVIRIMERIEGLAIEPRPRGSIKLGGQERYRLRQGVYRILYEVEDDERQVTVVKVAHRKDAYR